MEILILGSLIILGFLVMYWLLGKKMEPQQGQASVLLEWVKSTQGEIKQLHTHLTQTLMQSDKNVTDTLQKSYQELHTRLDNASKVIQELKNETGKFSEIGRSMQALHDFLNTPKLRGNLGEHLLLELCAQVLPSKTYSPQYRFENGETVDMIIKTHSGFIPIDAKFPMDNYVKMNKCQTKEERQGYQKLFTQDVKKHIKTIADKYIKPSEKTTDFALMYVPAEAIYYEITANTPELDEVARTYRILPVSPSTFYAFLRTILVSFEGQRIQEEAAHILTNLRSIQKEAVLFEEKLQILQKHVTNAYHNMTGVTADFTRLSNKIGATQQLGAGVSEQEETEHAHLSL